MMLSLLMSVPWSISSFAVDRLVGEIDEEVVHEKTEDLELAEVVEIGRQRRTLSSSSDSSVLVVLLFLNR